MNLHKLEKISGGCRGALNSARNCLIQWTSVCFCSKDFLSKSVSSHGKRSTLLTVRWQVWSWAAPAFAGIEGLQFARVGVLCQDCHYSFCIAKIGWHTVYGLSKKCKAGSFFCKRHAWIWTFSWKRCRFLAGVDTRSHGWDFYWSAELRRVCSGRRINWSSWKSICSGANASNGMCIWRVQNADNKP